MVQHMKPQTTECFPSHVFIVFDESQGCRKILHHQEENDLDPVMQETMMALGVAAFEKPILRRESSSPLDLLNPHASAPNIMGDDLASDSGNFGTLEEDEEELNALVSNDSSANVEDEAISNLTDSDSDGDHDLHSDASSRNRLKCSEKVAGVSLKRKTEEIHRKLDILKGLMGGEFSSNAEILGEAIRTLKVLQLRLCSALVKL